MRRRNLVRGDTFDDGASEPVTDCLGGSEQSRCLERGDLCPEEPELVQDGAGGCLHVVGETQIEAFEGVLDCRLTISPRALEPADDQTQVREDRVIVVLACEPLRLGEKARARVWIACRRGQAANLGERDDDAARVVELTSERQRLAGQLERVGTLASRVREMTEQVDAAAPSRSPTDR